MIYNKLTIIGDLETIFEENQINYLFHHNYVEQLGRDELEYIDLRNLFTIDEIKNKIDKICKERWNDRI